jgi:GDP-4-dehydro-6-deoxy-D-mannose reductase
VRTLVTGANGFAARFLLAELGEDGIASTDDVTGPLDLDRADAVAHLAAKSSVAASWDDPLETWRVNVVGTVNVLEAARTQRPAARVLSVSSAEVYGPTDAAAREDDELRPASPYAASKAAAELACRNASRHGVDVVVARPFAHVGPGQSERFALGSWIAQVARLEREGGGVLEVGDTSVVRDVTDVRDIARAYRLLLDPAVPAGVYNVCSGHGVALAELLDTLAGLARVPIEVRQDPSRMRAADIPQLVGDPSKLATATGWAPAISLEQTLADALDHARETA